MILPILLLFTALEAFAGGTKEPKKGTEPATAVAAGKEAPMLAQLVAEGKLPKLEERIPKNPRVVKVFERIGEYGGELHTAIRGAPDTSLLSTSFHYDPLVKWNPSNTAVEPNIAESWEVNDDATVYTFKLRKGIKWSDGHPLTSDDFVFYFEDVAMNEKLPQAQQYLRQSGEWSIEKVDDLTFRFVFEKPNAFLLQQICSTFGDELTSYPAHYMKQFHIKYNADADKIAKAAGFADWADMFEAKSESWDNPERPVTYAWVPKIAIGKATTEYVMERNPYYYKVDPEGNQLPYIDRIVFHMYTENEALILQILSGEIDFMAQRVNTLKNKAVFVDNMERGDYRIFNITAGAANVVSIHLNQTVQNPVLREVFRNKKFRIGLSHAINRQEIIDAVYVSQGEPSQVAPRKGSGYYNENLAKQYTEYSLDLANKYLDEAGYAKRDSQGWRLGPDGKRLTFTMTTRIDKIWMADTMELVVPMWNKVGVYALNRPVEKSLQRATREANQHQGIIDDGEAGWSDTILRPDMFVPCSDNSAWGTAWFNWYYGLKDREQEEPPPAIKKSCELFDKIQVTGDPEERNKLMREILAIAQDEFLTFGIATPADLYGIARNRLRNIPETYVEGWKFCQPGSSNLAQFFFEGGRRK
jgi:peptide/nickel transport system substrate-binding protein